MTDLDVHKLVDFDKCLNDDGVIHYVAFEPGQWRWIRYANSGLFDLNKKDERLFRRRIGTVFVFTADTS